MLELDRTFLDRYAISPSQVETFECERKWALRQLDRIRPPPNRYAYRGLGVHKVLEDWEKDGTPIDFDSEFGKIINPGLRFLPRPGTHQTEHEFLFRTATATYTGKKDLKSPRGMPIRSVWDHKTTTNFKWIKPPEKLRKDPQAVIYAVSEIEEAKELGEHIERVEENWIYYLADPEKPRARKVQLHVLPDKSTRVPVCNPKEVKKEHFGIMYYDELYEHFGAIEETSQKILHYRKLFLEGDIHGGADVPYNIDVCDKFGGCPYRDQACKLTVSERLRGMEAQVKLADKMKNALKPGATSTAGAKPSAGAVAQAEEIKAGAANGAAAATTSAAGAASAVKATATAKPPPDINPPEHGSGVDPDSAAGKLAARVDPGDRMNVVVSMAQAIVTARIYTVGDDGRAPTKIAKLAVELADAVLAELAKPKK